MKPKKSKFIFVKIFDENNNIKTIFPIATDKSSQIEFELPLTVNIKRIVFEKAKEKGNE